VQNLVVRPSRDGTYEVLSGQPETETAAGIRAETIPCVVVELDDAQARLLAQALTTSGGRMTWAGERP